MNKKDSISVVLSIQPPPIDNQIRVPKYNNDKIDTISFIDYEENLLTEMKGDK